MLAVKHLVDQGRKKILLVTGPREHFFSEEIKKGYKAALTDAGLSFDPSMVLYTDFTVRSATEKVTEFMDAGGQFDAVFTNDEMATGVYRILHEFKLKIPQDISICGCDDLPVGKQLYPELTSISLNYAELAKYAIKHLTDTEHYTNTVHVKLPPILKIGKSSKIKSHC